MPSFAMAGSSHPGRKRSNNEDAFVFSEHGGWCAVADGMGGAAAGEVASRIFVETASEMLNDVQWSQTPQDYIKRTFERAHTKIKEHVKAHPHHEGMGCTAELLLLNAHHYTLGHVGDSRTYLFRNHTLLQITLDHSVVQDQLNRGLITPEEAAHHPLRHVILRAVGIEEQLGLDIVRGTLARDDLFLMCTDGLTDMVSDEVIKQILSDRLNLEQRAAALIEEANTAGGRDNITVVLVQTIEP